MARYTVDLSTVSLRITDTPIEYTPPRGPKIDFVISYSQRDADQSSSQAYSNLGPNWTFNWLSYVTDNPVNDSADVSIYVRGGGTEIYSGFDPGTHTYAPDPQSQAILVRMGSGAGTSYEKRFPDGSKFVYAHSNGAPTHPRLIFLTQVIDPTGNAATIHYPNDNTNRIDYIEDALGQRTTFYYENNSYPNRVTKVEDPFHRHAVLGYYPNGQLMSSTDPVGIVSTFGYASGTNFINSLATPYGNATFETGESGTNRWLNLTDPTLPEPGRERVEYRDNAPGIFPSDPANTVPAINGIVNSGLDVRNTFYWDKQALALYPPDPQTGHYDYTQAKIYHWLLSSDGTTVSGTAASERMARENRVWHTYPGQPAPDRIGAIANPNQTARVLDDETTQLYSYEYNDLGNVTKAIDPAGRVTSYVYDPNKVDLIAVYQRNPSGITPDPDGQSSDLIASYSYNAKHEPLTAGDADGQSTITSYNDNGQVLTVTNRMSEVTTYSYGQTVPDGYLASITGPTFNGSAPMTSFTYDSAHRVHTVMAPDGYVVVTDYDDLDRPTDITYPDTSSRHFDYTDEARGMTLDVTAAKDRLGRWTYRHYNANEQMDSVTDTAGRQTLYGWCTCGALTQITDPDGHVTKFDRDVQSRLMLKTFAFGTLEHQAVSYTYENTTSRLKSMTDAMSQSTNYDYQVDNNLSHVLYSNAQNPTPNLTYAYDPYYNRVTSVTSSGAGVINATINYQYYPLAQDPPIPGANRVKTVSDSFLSDTILYSYDQLGRTITQSIDGVTSSVHYDSLGRMDTSNNQLGNFTRAYDGVTPRLQRLTYPNTVRADYSYFGDAQDHRLRTLLNSTTGSGATTLSQFDFTYDSGGEIQTLTKNLSGYQANLFLGYDNARELTNVSSGIQQFDYGYDDASNRYDVKTYTGLALQSERLYTVNNLNQLDTVSVNQGGPVPLHYDNNGNLTDDAGGKTYEWDAANRLVAINYTATGSRTEFAYDGLGRRVKITEYGPGITATIQPEGTAYDPFTSEPFVLPSGSYTLTFSGLNPATPGNTNTVLLDAVQLNGTMVTNGGFETPVVQDYQVAPAGSSWSYSGSSGIAANGGTLTGGNPPAPEGNQVAFIQNDASLWQGAMVAGGTYTLNFSAAQRSGNETYQRLRLSLRPASGPTNVKTFVWSGNTVAEERDATGSTVKKRFFAEGEQRIGGSDAGLYYYTRDHLGSIRDVTNSIGTLKGQYDYDAWGNSTVNKGKMQVDFGFTGHYFHQPSGINLAMYRGYSPTLGRWISRDPIGEEGGLNLYGYVGNNPIGNIDPLGLYWFRQPWQTDYVVGRPGTPVPPGGLISRLIENDVPAGRTFGEMHDNFVDAATRAGIPDWLANIPSMSYVYQEALITEVLRTLGILPQPTQCK